MNQLLSTTRMSALAELEVTQPEDAYPLVEFLDDVRAAVWQDLARVSELGTYRRALQRAYLERMESLMTEEPPSFPFGPVSQDVSTSDIRPLVREQLRSLRDVVSRRVNRGNADRVTMAHLSDVVARIDDILDPGSG